MPFTCSQTAKQAQHRKKGLLGVCICMHTPSLDSTLCSVCCSPLHLCLLRLPLVHHRVVIIPGLAHARSGHTLKESLNLLSTVSEVIRPEIVSGVLDQLNEGDEQAPWVWPVHNQPLQQDSGDLLLYNFLKTQSTAQCPPPVLCHATSLHGGNSWHV